MDNEIVVIELPGDARVRLHNRLRERLDGLGLSRNLNELNTGIEWPVDWPWGENTEVTLPQLVVLANKLKMQIKITELNVAPRTETAQVEVAAGGANG